MALNSRKLAEQKFDEALVINYYKDDISSLDVKNSPNNK